MNYMLKAHMQVDLRLDNTPPSRVLAPRHIQRPKYLPTFPKRLLPKSGINVRTIRLPFRPMLIKRNNVIHSASNLAQYL